MADKKMVSYRMSPEMRKRIEQLSKATRLKKTTIVEICVEEGLPALEKKYARELAALPPDLEGGRASSPTKREGKAEDILEVLDKHYPSGKPRQK